MVNYKNLFVTSKNQSNTSYQTEMHLHPSVRVALVVWMTVCGRYQRSMKVGRSTITNTVELLLR